MSDDEKDVADVAAQDVAAATAKVSQLAEAASGLAAVVPAPGQAAVDLSDDQKEMLRKATLEIATQLQTITAEMDRMKNELYGDQGLGLLKKELDQIKNQGDAFFSEKCASDHPRASRPERDQQRHEGHDQQRHEGHSRPSPCTANVPGVTPPNAWH